MEDVKINSIENKATAFIRSFAIANATPPYDGMFSLHMHSETEDLYGMLDALYSLHIIGKLEHFTTKSSRATWAGKILACQDKTGYFTGKNLRKHSAEHATAYAIGGLKLLEIENDENYLNLLQPLAFLIPLLTSENAFIRWISRMGLNSVTDIFHKNLGWHYIWRGSHVGGGIAATIGMTSGLFNSWWPEKAISYTRWFELFFLYLNSVINTDTGLWQRAFYNRFYRKATINDLGGASHFWWIYQKYNVSLPKPENAIHSILSLQKPSGLFKGYPFCIDFDGVNGLCTALLQIESQSNRSLKISVITAVEKAQEGILNFLLQCDFETIYSDSHGLPGALAAIKECARISQFSVVRDPVLWNNVLDKIWWL